MGAREKSGGRAWCNLSHVANTRRKVHDAPLCLPARPLQTGILPYGEAICSIPTTLSALCLNVAGLKRVQDSRSLETLLPVLTGRKYVKALSGDTPSLLGAGLEEMLRSAPSLRPTGVDVVLAVLRYVSWLLRQRYMLFGTSN